MSIVGGISWLVFVFTVAVLHFPGTHWNQSNVKIALLFYSESHARCETDVGTRLTAQINARGVCNAPTPSECANVFHFVHRIFKCEEVMYSSEECAASKCNRRIG